MKADEIIIFYNNPIDLYCHYPSEKRINQMASSMLNFVNVFFDKVISLHYIVFRNFN